MGDIGDAMKKTFLFFGAICIVGVAIGQVESAAIAGIISAASFVGAYILKL
jgi:hypothetical protein